MLHHFEGTPVKKEAGDGQKPESRKP
jgi:hypothetical protein